MRRSFVILGVAAAALCLAASPALAEQDHRRHDERGGRPEHSERGDRGAAPPEHYERGYREDHSERLDRGAGPPEREGRGDRREGHWDDNRNNGYWFNNRWYFGPPPRAYYDQPNFRPGYSAWQRGGYLPPYYNGWALEDYWTFHLRRPPRGYHWVRIGDDFLLVSDSSGLIFDVITGRQ